MSAVVGAVLAVLLGAAAPLARAEGLALRDDLGRVVNLAQSPRRIVSLLPSVTETICALGACGRLVATDRFSDWPAEVRTLPKAGGLEDPQIESVVRLRPDLVLISDTQRITDRLRELGVASYALKSESYAAIAHTVTVLLSLIHI